MSGARIKVAFFQAARVFLALLLAGNGVALATGGFQILNAAAVAFLAVAIAAYTYLIRQAHRPVVTRPDYAAIARMERDIWGQSFTHTRAPAVASPGGPELSLETELNRVVRHAEARNRQRNPNWLCDRCAVALRWEDDMCAACERTWRTDR
jgi:hypothetical protein